MRPDERDIDAVITRALDEDVGSGDITTLATVDENQRAVARLVAREAGVVAGLEVAARVFAHLDERVDITWSAADGAAVQRGSRVGRLEGPARPILTGERTALNILQRMSGIATQTSRMVEAARPATILDTRKTAPGLRTLDKWAVALGGGQNHRVGLHDMILIKDNHIAAAGGLAEAVRRANAYRRKHSLDALIEVEVRTEAELDELLHHGGADWVLLDNMTEVHDDGFIDIARLREAVRRVRDRMKTEASGDITLETVPAVASTGVDYISSGALTHSVKALNLSLEFELV